MGGLRMSVHVHNAEIAPGIERQHLLVHCDGDTCDQVADHTRIMTGWIMVTYYRDDVEDDMQREQHFCSQTCARFNEREHVWSQPQVNNPHRR